jgi:Domain of unknown function (DUF4405)
MTRTNFVIDIVIFLTLLVANSPHFTGIPIHEWLSFAFAGAILVHLVLHWNWVVNTVRRFLSSASGQARVNFVLNTLLFVDFTLITLSGIMISEHALPLFGIEIARNFAWRGIHDLTANLMIVLIGAHLAMHWRWIAGVVSKLFVRRAAPVAAPIKGGK